MKNIVPPNNLPDHVQAMRFGASEEMKEAGIDDAYGIAHYPEHLTDPDKRYPGDVVAIELMFQVSQEEILTLMHEPYITLVMLTDSMPPTSLQTTHEYDPRYQLMVEHTHRCPECDEHYRCMNPLHKMPESRKLICDSCWHENMEVSKDGTPEQDAVDEDDPGEVE